MLINGCIDGTELTKPKSALDTSNGLARNGPTDRQLVAAVVLYEHLSCIDLTSTDCSQGVTLRTRDVRVEK